jgi:hypothetical protein
MRASTSGAFLIALGLLTGCGGQSPSAPSSSGPGASNPLSIVATSVSQAAMTTVIAPDALSRTLTYSCDGGGSTSITVSSTGAGQSGPFTSSSRIEFTDCRSQTVTINGDPAILIDGTSTVETATGSNQKTVTATMRMTGGLRVDAAGTPSGRARYDCTMVMSVQIGSNGIPAQQTFTSSGTITWEQGGTVTVHSCGA